MNSLQGGDPHTNDEQPTGPPSSVLGGRLAAESDEPTPTFQQLGLSDAKAVAFDWQHQRSYASWHEFTVIAHDLAASEWVREIHGIVGVVGEVLLVCIEAEVEKEILSRRLVDPPSVTTSELSTRAAASRSLRFFAEGQGNELTVAGHALANLTLRTVSFIPTSQSPRSLANFALIHRNSSRRPRTDKRGPR